MIKINDLKPFEENLYRNLSLNQLTVYVIDFMQSEGIPVTFENITIVLFRLFPKKFHMVGFEEYPDATRVNRALLQLRPKYRNWALGDVRKGFILTKSGENIAKRTSELLKSNGKTAYQKNSINKENERARAQDADISKIENSALFKKYKESKLDEVKSLDLYDMLEAFPQSPHKVINSMLIKYSKQAKYLERKDIQEFIEWVRKRFSTVLLETSY